MSAEDRTLKSSDDDALKAGYDVVESLLLNASGSLMGGPGWNGWELREAFHLGREFEKRRAAQNLQDQISRYETDESAAVRELFVGGPLDGQRKTIRHGLKDVQVMLSRGVPIRPIEPLEVSIEPLEFVTYRKVALADHDGTRLYVWCVEERTLLRDLIDGYQRQP